MKVIAISYSIGFLWDLGKAVLHLQNLSPQPLLLPSPWDVGPSHPVPAVTRGWGPLPAQVLLRGLGDGAARGHLGGLQGTDLLSPQACVHCSTLGAELGSCRVPASETLTTVGMGDVGQAPWPLRFLPAQMSVQPTPALGRFTEQQ